MGGANSKYAALFKFSKIVIWLQLILILRNSSLSISTSYVCPEHFIQGYKAQVGITICVHISFEDRTANNF